MTADAGEDARKRAQTRAIDIHRPAGALINHSYLERKQEIVAVNRNDLEDILQFDEMSAWLATGGLFFLSGAVWLAVDRLTSGPFALSPALAVCALSALFGGVLLYAAFRMYKRKRNRIQRIFDETTPIG